MKIDTVELEITQNEWVRGKMRSVKKCEEFVKKKDLENFESFIRNKNTKFIGPDDKVYIHPETTFPKNLFIKVYGKQSIVNNISGATVIVANPSSIIHSKTAEYDTIQLYTCQDGSYAWDSTMNEVINANAVIEDYCEVDSDDLRSWNGWYTKLSDKFIISPEDICFGGEDLTDGVYDKLKAMFSSNDKEMHALGKKIIVNCEFSSNKDRIACLFASVENIQNGELDIDGIKDKDFYYIMKRVEQMQFYESQSWDDGEMFAFWIDLSVRNSNDKIIIREANEYFSRVLDYKVNVTVEKI